MLTELQIDRLVGPTYHFGGLGVGNLASQQHAGQASNPAAAAMQGLDKMRLVSSFGVQQMILPPQPRPAFDFLRALGFGGSNADVLRRARETAPQLLSAATSCSAIWTANAATVTPGIDSGRRLTEVTIANLSASMHRAIEADSTHQELQRLLTTGCHINPPLPGGTAMRDEGAANHIRLGTADEQPGINIFVYGDGETAPKRHWPRQARAACEAIARLHGLPAENTFLLKQHPAAIDAGSFHNDVVAMSHHGLLVHHELAFEDAEPALKRLEQRFEQLTGRPLTRIQVQQHELSIDDAVNTYLFNSQILSSSDASSAPVILGTSQVRDHPTARALVTQWRDQGLLREVHFVEVGQSMADGGGPACLRLRVPVPEPIASQLSANHWSPATDERLRAIIEQDYVTSLSLEELARSDFHEHAQVIQHRVREALAGN